MPYKRRKNIRSIVSASLAGLAGGAAFGSPFGPAGMVVGSIAGGVVTGAAEYIREDKGRSGKKNSKKVGPRPTVTAH